MIWTCKECERFEICSEDIGGLDTEAIDCHLYKPKNHTPDDVIAYFRSGIEIAESCTDNPCNLCVPVSAVKSLLEIVEHLKAELATIRADTIKALAENIKRFYQLLPGKTVGVAVAYTVELKAKEMLEKICERKEING